jgi:arsenate reductase (glutaredoxin)
LDEATLTRLLKAMALSPRDLIRTNEAVYKNLDLKNLALSDQELIALMVEHPDLVQRPILEVDGRAVLGRPPECILDLLSATPK